jgi:hypothetical protein
VRIRASDLAEAISAMERAEQYIRNLGIDRSEADIDLQVDLEFAAKKLRNGLLEVGVDIEADK